MTDRAAPPRLLRHNYLGPLDDGITWPKDIPADVARGHAKECAELDATIGTLRAALIRLLWREVADGGGCVCEEDAAPAGRGVSWDRSLTDTCQAMRALGWGEHWDADGFQRKAMPIPDASESEPSK